MTNQLDVAVGDGRRVRAYSTGSDGTDRPVLVWHNGTPHTGVPLAPLVASAAERGIRLISYARPGYGDSSPRPGRSVASAADDVARITDAFGVGRFAVMGASGGGPHALACASLLPGRVTGVVTLAGVAPFTEEYDWFAGMAGPGALRAARVGREERARFAETAEFDPASFVAADWAALNGEWASLGADAGTAAARGPDGEIDDDVAFASPWGFDVASVRAPALVVQGGLDRVIPASHGRWLAQHLPDAELWHRPDDGHVSVLAAVPDAMDWLTERA
jgi:pimeloyl-ACP methyl ester carboxylesterase